MFDNPAITNLLFPIVVSVMSTIIIYQFKEMRSIHKQENNEEKAKIEGIRALLRDRLIEMHDKYTERGSIPDYALESFNKMYKSYIDLHGNGMIPGMHNEVNRLEINRHYEGGD